MNDIMNIGGIECYEKDGVAYLKLETVALGLDITKTDRKNGIEYKRVNRRALQKWLFSFGILNSENDELPDFIPENIFYRLAMKAKNEAAEAFQAKIADEVIPSIRKTGGYIAGQARLVNPPEVSPGGLAKLISTTRRVMLDMGCTPQEIGVAMQNIYRTWHIPVPEFHSRIVSEQLSLFNYPALQNG